MDTFRTQSIWHCGVQRALAGTSAPFLFNGDTLLIAAGGLLTGIDRFTGNQVFQNQISTPSGSGVVSMCFFGGRLLVADGQDYGQIFVGSPSGGTFQNLLGAGGRVEGRIWDIYGIGRHVYAITNEGIHQIGQKTRGWGVLSTTYGSRTPAGYDPASHTAYVVGTESTYNVSAVSLPQMKGLWTRPLNAYTNFRPTVLRDHLLVGTAYDDNTVYALNRSDGTVAWQKKVGAEISANVAASDRFIYVAGNNQLIYALDRASIGSDPDFFKVSTPATEMLFGQADQVLYVSSNDLIYGYSEISKTEVAMKVGSKPGIIASNGQDVIVNAGSTVSSLNFRQVLSQFTVESELMQDFTPVADKPLGKDSGLTKTSTYSTEIKLKNTDGTPLGLTDVQIWSETPATVMVNGISHNLTNISPTTVKTNNVGTLRVESLADGLTAVPLRLSAPFLDNTAFIAIYPDHAVHEDLSQTNGTALQNAVDFDGNQILDSAYLPDPSDPTKSEAAQQRRDAAAAAIAEAAGMARHDGKPAAHPEAMRAFVIPGEHGENINAGAVLISDPAHLSRPLQLANGWHFTLGTGTDVFRSGLTPDEVRQIKHQQQTRSGGIPTWSGSIWDAIRSSGARILHAVVAGAEAAAEVIEAAGEIMVNGVRYAFNQVLSTVEHAFTFIQGIFNEIVAGVSKALEWLSFVFSWDAILEKHEQIKTSVLSTLESLKSKDVMGMVIPQVDALFKNFKAMMDSGFDSLRSGLGQESFNSQRPPAGEAMPGGARSTMIADRAFRQDGPAEGLQARTIPDDSWSFSLGESVVTAISDLIADMKDQISDDLWQTFEQMASGFSNMTPSNFLASGLAAILTLMEGVLDIVVDVGDALVIGLLKVLKSLIDSDFFQKILTTEIKLPFISTLYTYLTGNEMSTLDVMALLIAIPVSVVERASGRASRQLRSDEAASIYEWNWLQIAGCGFIFWALIDVGIEVFEIIKEVLTKDMQNPLKGEEILFSINAILGISVPAILQLMLINDAIKTITDAASVAVPVWMIWSLAWLPIALDSFSMIAVHDLSRYEKIMQGILLIIGLIYFAIFIWYKIAFPKYSPGNDNNAINVLPMVFCLIKWIRNFKIGPVPGPALVAAVDGILNFSTGLIMLTRRETKA